MRLFLHPKVYSDIEKIMHYYEQVATQTLADQFYSELRQLMIQAAAAPEQFAIRQGDIHRANLRRFPYHFLFRVVGDAVRILVIRHHRRHSNIGSERR
ncbi:MAG: type II toxin-antitoxin system RelE/ParE family toxin [Chthoniobacterales bacterium]